jgi:hypothetical protein
MGPWAQAKPASPNTKIEVTAIVLEFFIMPRSSLKDLPLYTRPAPSETDFFVANSAATQRTLSQLRPEAFRFVAQGTRQPGAKRTAKLKSAGPWGFSSCRSSKHSVILKSSVAFPIVKDAAQGDARCLPRILY